MNTVQSTQGGGGSGKDKGLEVSTIRYTRQLYYIFIFYV